jgi:hypothetical protein
MTNVLVSCISLLSLSTLSTPTPLERLDLSSTYLPLMYETHITPLAVIQGILPMFRISSSRQGLGKSRGSTARTSIIALVPAISSRVGVAFNSANAMAMAGFVKGLEVLRRELEDTDVVIVDVGSIFVPKDVAAASSQKGAASEGEPEPDIITLTKAWSASERRAYGPAYEAALVHSSTVSKPSVSHHRRQRRTPHPRRQPTDIDTLLASVIPLVHAHKFSKSRWHPLYVVTHLSKTWRRMNLYFRGYRIGVGAGAGTYTIASLLPYWLLDAILALPATLVSWKHTLMPPPPLPSRPISKQEEVTSIATTGQRDNKGKRPMGLVEEKVVSTAPASTASGDSRRESIGSFEGVAIGLDSGDEVPLSKKASSANGSHAGGQGHSVLPESLTAQSTVSLSASVLSDGHVRTPSIGSGHLLSQSLQGPATERSERMTESWVSLSESTTH